MKRFSFILLALVVALSPCRADRDTSAPAKTTLHIGKATVNAEIAATPAQEQRGLMYRTSMGDNDGMLFFLPGPERADFWMKNTLIPLSIAFLDKNGVILEIYDMQPGDPNLPDEQLPRTRSESDQICYALEMNLHWFSLNGIKPGEKILPPPSTLKP